MNTRGLATRPAPVKRHPYVDFGMEPVGDQPVIETFRLLALQVRNSIDALSRPSVMVMSARPADGRSLVASSLASAITPHVGPVLIVDADVVGAGLASNNSATPWPEDGLVIHPDGDGASLMPAVYRYRVDTRRQSQLQIVDQVRGVLDLAQSRGVFAIVDTPACLVSSLAFSVIDLVGGILYVARRRFEDPSVHQEIRSQLDRLGATVLGVVFNEM